MRKKLFLLIISFLILIPINASAEESNVYANTKQTTNGTINTKMQNGSASTSLGNYNISIVNTNKSDNSDVVIIPSTSNTLSWVQKQLSGYTINKAFNVTFYNNGQKVLPSGSITIHITGTTGKKIISLDSNGRVISKSESYTKIMNNEEYIVVATESSVSSSSSQTSQTTQKTSEPIIKKLVYIDCDDNGVIAIDGIIYKGTNQVNLNSDKVKVALIPNQNYEIGKVFINNKDVTNNVSSGFITLKKGESLKVIYKQEVQTNIGSYTISGKLTKDGQPLKNITVILHSKEMKTTTNEYGYYMFENVTEGHHTISAYNGENLIGYKDFYINRSTTTNISDENTINVNEQDRNIKVNLNIEDYEITFADIEKDNELKESEEPDIAILPKDEKKSLCVILLLVIIISAQIMILILLIKKRRAKKEEKIEVLDINGK